MTETRRHVHEEVFEGASVERVFALLHTPSAIRQWWGAACAIVVAQPNGFWAVAWGEDEDDPDYLGGCVISEFEPPRCMVLSEQRYVARDAPLPFEADFVTTFEVESHANGALLRVTHDGFPLGPEADTFYADCETGWRNSFAGIRTFLAL